jgi:hypothetical protein
MWGKEWARLPADWLRIMSLACPALAERLERGRRVYLLGADAAASSVSGPGIVAQAGGNPAGLHARVHNILRARVTVA